jgi:hypothetical protein
MTSTRSTTTRLEPTPLYIQTLRNYRKDLDNDNDNHHPTKTQEKETVLDGGHYETVHTLITSSPLHDNGGEIETCLQQFVQQDGSILWRRVVVKGGPSTTATTSAATTTTTPIVHASFLLPDDFHNHNSSNNNTSTVPTTNSNNNVLCWASFASTTNHDALDHVFLCVLAHPTLLCIWDVYPQQQHQHGSITKKHANASASTRASGVSGEGQYVPLPFEACGIFAVNTAGSSASTPLGGLLIQRCETVEDLYAFDTISQHHQSMINENQDDDNDDDDDDDDFVLQAPPRPVRVGRESTGGTLSNLHVSTDTGLVNTNSSGVQNHGNNNSSINNMVPSLFSLSHPKGDILPVSTQLSNQNTSVMGPVTDVFEKILFVGTMKWLDDNTNVDWWTRREQSQSIVVTYHNQLKR